MYTGHMFETDVLGECQWRWSEYVPFRQAMARVKRSQAWDPTDPEPRLASDLHTYICMALGVEDYSEVALYTAVGSPLDRFHGVDGFVEFRGQLVTIDVTMNTRKDSYKADLIVQAVEVESDLESVGQRIAAQLL